VAVLPFLNESLRRNADEIMALHFVNELEKNPKFSVIEPGVVRQKLLASRLVLVEGFSSTAIDTIAAGLGADLLVTGTVHEYQQSEGPSGEPMVEFSAQVIDAPTRKTVWSSKSYASGREKVFFFDWGAIGTASSLAAEMVGAIANRLATPEALPLENESDINPR
jgi:TolB-like protein